MIWAINLITQAENTGKIKLDPPILASLQSGFENIEAQNRKLLNYSWVNYPLPYTQVIQNYKSQGIKSIPIKIIVLSDNNNHLNYYRLLRWPCFVIFCRPCLVDNFWCQMKKYRIRLYFQTHRVQFIILQDGHSLTILPIFTYLFLP